MFGFNRGWEEHIISDRLSGDSLVEKAKDIINSVKCPFLGYMHFMENHEPYSDYWNLASHSIDIKEAEKCYNSMLAQPDSGASDKLYRFAYKHFSRYSTSFRKSFFRHQSKKSQHYTNLINYISCAYKFDALVSEMIRFLEDTHKLEDTIVIILSDHGEGFGERKGSDNRHGYSLYDETLRIPLVIYNPNFRNSIVGNRFSICNLIQIIKNIQINKSNLLNDVVFPEELMAISKMKKSIKIGAMLKGPYKFIKNYIAGTKEGFDIYKDPGETLSILDSSGSVFIDMEKRLDMDMIKADANEGKEEVVFDGEYTQG